MRPWLPAVFLGLCVPSIAIEAGRVRPSIPGGTLWEDIHLHIGQASMLATGERATPVFDELGPLLGLSPRAIVLLGQLAEVELRVARAESWPRTREDDLSKVYAEQTAAIDRVRSAIQSAAKEHAVGRWILEQRMMVDYARELEDREWSEEARKVPLPPLEEFWRMPELLKEHPEVQRAGKVAELHRRLDGIVKYQKQREKGFRERRKRERAQMATRSREGTKRTAK